GPRAYRRRGDAVRDGGRPPVSASRPSGAGAAPGAHGAAAGGGHVSGRDPARVRRAGDRPAGGGLMETYARLTPEQEALLSVVRDEWLAVGLSTEPADRSRAEAGVVAAYRAAGLEPPATVIWLDSPLAGAIAAAAIAVGAREP